MTRQKHTAQRRGQNRRGPSQRQLRVGEAVRHALSRLIERGAIHDPELAGASITVTEVSMSPDLRVAAVYVLPLGGNSGTDGAGTTPATVDALNRVAPALRRMLGPMVSLKFLPELRFSPDTTFDRAGRIEALLREAGDGSRDTGEDAPEGGNDGP